MKNWIEQFDKKFPPYHFSKTITKDFIILDEHTLRIDIKQFISDLLKERDKD